jgi:hypothetical protein
MGKKRNTNTFKCVTKPLCEAIFGICLLLIIGIAGGIECGEPMRNALWFIPLLATMGITGYIGGFLY